MNNMLKEITKTQERFNAAMNSDDAFINHSEDLIKELSALVKKYPSEIFPLMQLRSIICKSRNQTKHIEILNQMIEMNNNDSLKEDLVNCKKQPCNECTIWDNVEKGNFSLQSKNINKPFK